MEINIVLMGQRIRATRKEKNISSDYLAEKVGIAVESLWHIENGARNDQTRTLLELCESMIPIIKKKM